MFKNEARSSNLNLFVCLFKYVCHNSSVNSNTSHKGQQEGRTQLVTGQAFMLPINAKDAKDRHSAPQALPLILLWALRFSLPLQLSRREKPGRDTKMQLFFTWSTFHKSQASLTELTLLSC